MPHPPHRWITLLLLMLPLVASRPARARADDAPREISLVGDWRFQLDPQDHGVQQKWYQTDLPEKVRLPGTLDENDKGLVNDAQEGGRLTRPIYWVGPAWYQRKVQIPPAWAGKHITLTLERSKHTTVWVDERRFGEQDSLVAPHVYDLSAALTPGEHRITILVNNARRPPVGDPHQVSEQTQTDWNGIVGRIELRATDPAWIDQVQVYPDVEKKATRISVTLGHTAPPPITGELTAVVAPVNAAGEESKPVSVRFAAGGGTIELEVPLGDQAKLWDEFSPALYRATVTLSARAGDTACADRAQITFGLRKFIANGTQFNINGRTIFLRGKHDACVFPLTGYAPMRVEEWEKVFRIAKEWGINHYRFHTWCPPDAAFAAADRVGIYLQPELPNWQVFGDNKAHDDYLREEGLRILRHFGNHPSFVMFSLGNEMGGSREKMAELVALFRRTDPRHLYAQGSNNFFWEPKLAAGDDYWTTMRTKIGADGAVRGSFSHADLPLGHVQVRPPSTLYNYSKAIDGVAVPVIGHEVGQYQVFPDFSEIDRYSGVLQARNLAKIEQNHDWRGLLPQARDFLRATAALSQICYREEIEAALRTPGFGGFQLLDLQDFPGQGTALVGMLNAFMEEKPGVDREAWRQFCAPVVPLAQFEKYTWTSAETFSAEVTLANYGPAPIGSAIASWTLSDPAGKQVASGRLVGCAVAQGALSPLGRIEIPLKPIGAPARLTLHIQLEGHEARNSYPLWVYPANADVKPPAGVKLVRSWADARPLLAEGGRVVLLPEPSRLHHSVEGFFTPDFWCYPMFREICRSNQRAPAPGTLGLLIDPTHPALRQFPTEFHSNWQWWSLVMNGRPIVLDGAPPEFRPFVQTIDNCYRYQRLGLIFEAKVARGRLLVCAIDLPALAKDRPEARQLLHSLLSYAASDEFKPKQNMDEATLAELLAAP